MEEQTKVEFRIIRSSQKTTLQFDSLFILLLNLSMPFLKHGTNYGAQSYLSISSHFTNESTNRIAGHAVTNRIVQFDNHDSWSVSLNFIAIHLSGSRNGKSTHRKRSYFILIVLFHLPSLLQQCRGIGSTLFIPIAPWNGSTVFVRNRKSNEKCTESLRKEYITKSPQNLIGKIMIIGSLFVVLYI